MEKRLIFLIGRHGGMTGRAEVSKGNIQITAMGLPRGENIEILAANRHHAVLIGSIKNESGKQVEWTGSCNENTFDHLVLCHDEGPIMWDGSMTLADASVIAARYAETERRKAAAYRTQADDAETTQFEQQKQELSLVKTKNIPEYADETGMFRTNEAGEAVDPVPEYLWPKGEIPWERYFAYGQAAQTPMDSDYRWRFVNAQAASGGNVYPCLLGRYAEKDNIRAMCMMINDTEVPNGSVVPTFRHQKTPDGRGWFVRIWEV